MVQRVSSEARRSLISGVLPTEPINPSRISIVVLRLARRDQLYGATEPIQRGRILL
jgi:hypothetical protein